jgi:hypothetical protein
MNWKTRAGFGSTPRPGDGLVRHAVGMADWHNNPVHPVTGVRGDERALRLELMHRLKRLAGAAEPAAVPMITNVAAANSVVVAASRVLKRMPEVESILRFMAEADARFLRGMTREERAATEAAWGRLMEGARRDAAALAAMPDRPAEG